MNKTLAKDYQQIKPPKIKLVLFFETLRQMEAWIFGPGVPRLFFD